ncbi:MAG: recombination protein RecR [bacterium]|jgi:recombination protein RecR
MNLPASLENLVLEFSKLPGIGYKTAKRLAFSLIFRPEQDARDLAQAILLAKEKLGVCSTCFGLAEDNVCPICSNGRRNKHLVCVVEEARNIFTIESAGFFNGVYHVLQGSISPMNGIGPDDLTIQVLENRVIEQEVNEVIIATNPTLEGEATAHYLMDCLEGKIPKISRLARGMPSGSDLELTDTNTLMRAFEGRTEL